MNDSEYDSLENLGYPFVLNSIGTFHLYFLPVALVGNVSTFLLIYYRTPKSYGAIKNYILFHQGFNILCDVMFSGLIQPIGFFPFCTVIIQGPLKYFFPSTIINYAVYGGSAIFTFTLMLGILFYRFQSLLDNSSKFKIRSDRKIHIFNISIALFLFFIYIASIFVGQSSEEYREKNVLSKYPFLEPMFYLDNSYVDTCEHNFLFTKIVLGLIQVFLVGWGSVSIMGSMHVLNSSKSSMSERTKKMQRSFTLRIMSQFSVPCNLLAVPATYIFISMLFDTRNKYTWLCNFIIYMCISIHSLAFSIITIILTEGYREAILDIVIKILPFKIERKPRKVFDQSSNLSTTKTRT